jgi:predicted MFS family arabinose efflux permease
VFGCHAAGFACGPLVGGLFYDHFGGYDEVIMTIAVVLVGASALFATLGRYPTFAREPDQENDRITRVAPELAI